MNYCDLPEFPKRYLRIRDGKVMATRNRWIFTILARRLSADQSGSVAIMAGFLILILFLCVGAAVDFGRAISVRAAIGRALDTSTLAGARLLSTSVATEAQVGETVTDFFEANMANAGFTDVSVGDIGVKIDSVNGKLEVDASAIVPTYFIRLAGIDNLTVATKSQSTYSRFDVEVALVLDLSGSMQPYVGDLKEAVASLLNILLPKDQPQSEAKVRVSIVPYAQGVRLTSSDALKVTDGYDNRCVTERSGAQKYTDAYFSTDNDGKYDPGEFGGGTAQNKGSSCPSTVLQPLTDDRAKIDTIVANLATATYTAGHTGINWGWFTLSPNWSGLWPAASKPSSYSDNRTLKFAILLTDGVFNTSYDWKTGACNSSGKKATTYTSPKYDCWDEAIESDSAATLGPQRAEALCNGIKSKKITVYSIAFNLNNTTSGLKAKAVMNKCASGSDHFFDAESPEQLVGAFSTIANKIQSIFISL